MRTIIAAAVVGALFAPAAIAAPSANSLFDPPLATQKRALPAAKGAPKATLTCNYYPHFMVKQIDEGEVGAAQLSIVAGEAAHKPACQRANLPGERVIDAKEWSGYFKGVKGDYAFFDSEDGVNGALGFAIFAAADGKKLFDDSALGGLQSVALDGAALTLRYKRSFSADCSAPHDGAACWSKIAAATGLEAASPPDCAAGYLKAKNELAKGRCEAQGKADAACLPAAIKEIEAQRWDEAPSVVVYDAQAVLQSGQSTIKPLGGERACHPSD
jgi:opacity protein-like surface antigen